MSEFPKALVAVISAALLAPNLAVPTPLGAVSTTATSGWPVASATLAANGETQPAKIKSLHFAASILGQEVISAWLGLYLCSNAADRKSVQQPRPIVQILACRSLQAQVGEPEKRTLLRKKKRSSVIRKIRTSERTGLCF